MGAQGVWVLVRGVGDIGSAVAHRLFREGYAVVLHDLPTPTITRRGMAFADAVFDGHAALGGVHAVRAHDLARVKEALASHNAIPVYVRDIGPLLADVRPSVLVDARMRKHAAPEAQRELAPLTIALGPDLVAGQHADVIVETSWEGLGAVITDGASRPLAGEPREIAGHARDRYVYPASLELHKIYRVVSDEEAIRQSDLRVVDESGEDYLYPAASFVPLGLPSRVRGSLLRRRRA